MLCIKPERKDRENVLSGVGEFVRPRSSYGHDYSKPEKGALVSEMLSRSFLPVFQLALGSYSGKLATAR